MVLRMIIYPKFTNYEFSDALRSLFRLFCMISCGVVRQLVGKINATHHNSSKRVSATLILGSRQRLNDISFLYFAFIFFIMLHS
jgi:hypothetical protein